MTSLKIMINKITFQMESPICFIERPNFDAILIYCYMREKYGNLNVQLDINPDVFPDLPIPYHKDGFPLASIMFWDTDMAIEQTGTWKKRWDNKNDDLADFGKNIRKVSTAQSQFKSYDMPLSLMSVPEVWFYFDSDNVQAVQRLILTQLAGIGKKVSQGYGMYSGFEITDSDKSFKNEVLRPLKCDSEFTKNVLNNIFVSGKEFTLNQRYCAWRPSYWDPANFAKCYYPGKT